MTEWKIVLSTLFIALAAARGAAGQSVIEKEMFDVEKARVYETTVLPHRPVRAPNGHLRNRVFIYLDDGVMTRREGDGPIHTIVVHRGDVGWIPASTGYISENTADRPIRIRMVDLKGPPSVPAPVTQLDPAVVDPRHYRVVLENDQVRVLRIHFEAHETSAKHQHILNRVVFVLNDQTGGKADDVRMAGAATHTEENASGHPADRIAVELK